MRSLQLTIELGDEYGLAASYSNLAQIAYEMGNYNLAASNLSKAEDISTKYNNYQVLVEVYRLWSELLEQKGNYKHSNRYIRKMLTYQDSVKKTQDHQKMSELQTRYFLDMKSREDSLQNLANARIYQMEMAQKEQQLKTQRIFSWGGVLLALLALLAAGSLYSAFKQKKKDNQIIAAQKALVEEKNREITDSITYAKRIQSAILPPQKKIKKHLQNSFILYKPKDIVAGDFYWLEPGEDSVLFAVADCTGHGVPGALVSVVCHNALNRAVREYGLSEPGKILDKAREIVVQEFEKSEEDIKDGMDISLCRLEIPGRKPGSPYSKTPNWEVKLEWAGANNPLWLIRQNERGVPLLIETKPDKQPIGMTDNPQAFTTHRMALQEGDAIYIFSDGYADQFGGPGGKKFKLRAVRDMLLSIYDKPMEEQMHIIDERHEQWKTCPRQLEQVDDICILGVKISAQR